MEIDSYTGFLFAGISGGISRSVDNGITWQRVANLPNDLARAFVGTSKGHIFVGTQRSGILMSRDAGDNWVGTNNGLTSMNVRALTIDAQGYVFASTYDDGVFRSAQSTTAVKERLGAIPLAFELAQNYPNPFNLSTIIAFSVPCPTHVVLQIFNTLGEEIITLANQLFEAGYHQVIWEAKGVASGVYFYRLQSREKTLTRKTILMR